VARVGRIVVALTAVAGLATASYLGLRSVGLVGPRTGCTATVDGREVALSLDQAQHAASIAAISVGRGLPARAATIALATAYQESDLRNLDHGDRDSLGLFQQRPSQGWGTPDQVTDPTYAANAFYDALVRVDGYGDLPVTQAAQAVQRSAFPEAYADHEADARVLASALTGWSPATFTCEVAPDDGLPVETLTESGLTPRAQQVADEARAMFGTLSLGGFEPGGVATGHMEGSAHYDGRAVDAFFAQDDPAAVARGWALAHWAVANADRLDIATVIYRDQLWTARRSAEGWRPYEPPGGPTDNATLRHLDHVHVDVVEGD
jgi:hypothetical protein